MGKTKRLFVFNNELAKKYPFLKKHLDYLSDVYCQKCHSTFSIGHGGLNDIEKHLKSNKHKNADCAASTSKSMNTFFKNTAPSSKDLEIAAVECVWAFHTIVENHSFRSMDCTSTLIKQCFEPKFHCARTKCSAIITNVFASYFLNQVLENLKQMNCFTMLTDASNHGDKKIFPVLVRYFDPYNGMLVKLIELESQPGETFFSPSLDSKLFDEFTCILNFLTNDTILKWNEEKVDTSDRWVKVFSNFKENQIPHDLMSNLIQYVLCLPGSNASTERLFSQMNKIWTKEKSQLKIETLKAILVTKTNVDMNCSEFYNFLKKSSLLFKSIVSNDKY